jgi:ADP-ribose pyrophosphatase YjhB (NUDIX family)
MSNQTFAVTIRALVIDQNQLLMVKHKPHHTYHALPGGRLEVGETIQDGLIRELIEETAVKPDVGKLIFINQFINATDHRVEFFFWIKNAADYRQADPTKATHGFEIAEILCSDAADPTLNLLPEFLQKKFSKLIELGEKHPLEIVSSF